ncbi:Polysaccharide deacetylase [Andreprevotia lacus DSM 23236]|jgi:peptidoglycan/xylan/chitin deacetylase (PgdA/CDA1 family)|uniref:Polysaccharide deacetylase n=1 Tax=Andreprevotia lacus DSM 23236 TaxID=1121001 RepID=A0A1W1X3Q0_9NEIS|nr:polysaccharide deacetylase family protein [Andreprevotia lacus]SMC18556.1 Polysaccharide deacetylase [Andreprevotia lacus DSM 23236]
MKRLRSALCAMLLLGATAAGAGDAPTAPIRFLLTFDDGPSLWDSRPTERILAQLADNDITPGIKALFFLQTEHAAHGGVPEGEALIRRECAAGHVVAVHSGAVRGHIPHTALDDTELAATLQQGRSHLDALCGHAAKVVRPPDWAFNTRTLALYRSLGLDMLLSDVEANDGKIYGWIISLRRRSHLHTELARVRAARDAGTLATVDGVMPVVVTFHDTNPYTAEHMGEYLHILTEAAQAAGLPLADPPFYTDGAALERAAWARRGDGGYARKSW